MTKEEIKKLEAKFSVKLPSVYAAFLLDFPKEVASALYVSGDLRINLTDRDVLDSAKSLQRLNSLVRRGKNWLVDASGKSQAWPRNYFVIGEDGCGNYYFIDTREKSGEVRLFDHEVGKLEKFAPSLASYVKKHVKSFKEFVVCAQKGDELRKKEQKTLKGRLTAAVRDENFKVLKTLLDEGADPDTIIVDDFLRDTLLSVALRGDSPHVAVKLLIQAGADVNKRANRDSEYPLTTAATMGDLKSTRLLVDAGANLLSRGYQNLTVLEELRKEVVDRPHLKPVITFLERVSGKSKKK